MKTTAATIDFGTGKIVTLISVCGNDNRTDILGAGSATYEGYCLRDDAYEPFWHDPENLNAAILKSVQEAEAQARTKLRDVYVGVPGGFAEVYAVIASLELQGADPHVTGEHIDEIFERAVQTISPVPGVVIHRSPAWFAVDDGKHTLEPVGMKGRELRALISFVVADRMFVEDINARLGSLGLTVRGFFSNASGQANLFLSDESRSHTAVLIDVGYLQTDVIVAEGDAVTCHAVVPVGGGHIAADLALALKLDMPLAEQLKRQYTFGLTSDNQEYTVATADSRTFKHEDIRPIVEARVEEIAELVNKALEEKGVRIGPWSNLYLTGGGLAMNKGGRDFFSAKLGYTVRDIPKRASKLQSPMYTSALGLADLVMDTALRQNAMNASSNPIIRFFRDLIG